MKWLALAMLAAIGGVSLAACEDYYDNDYGYYGYHNGYYDRGYYDHDRYARRGYYDSDGYWHSYRYRDRDYDYDYDGY